MRRLVTWAVVSLGIAALARRLRRRAAESSTPVVDAAPADDPADELRRKLAASRAEEELVEPPVSAPETVEDRRAEVHDSGRATIEAMRESEDA